MGGMKFDESDTRDSGWLSIEFSASGFMVINSDFILRGGV